MIDNKTQKLPAGRYFIGDPCYVFSKDETLWRDFVRSSPDPKIFINNKMIVSLTTPLGDGVYEDAEGNRYTVDSGCISIIHEDIFTSFVEEQDLINFGLFKDFNKEVFMEYLDEYFVVTDTVDEVRIKVE